MLTAFAFFAGGIAVIIVGISQWDRVRAARHWSTVDGEVSSARVIEEDDSDGKRYRPEIRYAYVVDGVEHAGSRRQLIKFGPHSRAYALDIVRRYRRGSRVKVYYDPQLPGDAALEVPARSPLPLLNIVIGTAISVVGVYKWWHLG